MDNAALYFPVLIEEICAAQGVDVGPGDWRKNPGPISTQLYRKYMCIEKELLQAQIARGNEPQDENRHEHEAGGSGNDYHPYDFQNFHVSLQEFQQSIDTRFQQVDERLESMHEMINDMQQGWNSTTDTMVHKLDDMSSIAQQQFEVLYHRQVVMQAELDRCNKMSVYYHSNPGPPKPTPTNAQLAGYRVPNLSRDMISGEIHELLPEVPAVSSFGPLPTFGRIPQMPPTPPFLPDPEFMPGIRIPLIASGQPLQGPMIGPFHYRAQPFTDASFSTTASFSPPSSSAPSSSQGAPQS